MTSAFRFVHCADLHLDAPFPNRSPAIRDRLAAEARATFDRLVRLCLDEEVHALLVAGDLFDETTLDVASEAWLVERLERLTSAGIDVVMSCGHSDPGHETGRASSLGARSDRFHLFTSAEPSEIVVRDRDGTVVGRVIGCGLPQADTTDNLVRNFPDPTGPEPTVGLAHVTAGEHGRDGISPATVEELEAKPYRYWALGHVHHRERILDQPAAWYPGALVSHGFDESGAGGALLVTVPAQGTAKVAFRPLSTVRWETITLDTLDAAQDMGTVTEALGNATDELRLDDDVHADQLWMLRFVLSGPSPMADRLRSPDEREALALALAEADDVLGAEILDGGLTRPMDLTEYANQPHVLGLSLEVIERALTDDAWADQLMPKALAGCESGDKERRREYLRELLVGLDREAAQVLLRNDDA